MFQKFCLAFFFFFLVHLQQCQGPRSDRINKCSDPWLFSWGLQQSFTRDPWDLWRFPSLRPRCPLGPIAATSCLVEEAMTLDAVKPVRKRQCLLSAVTKQHGTRWHFIYRQMGGPFRVVSLCIWGSFFVQSLNHRETALLPLARLWLLPTSQHQPQTVKSYFPYQHFIIFFQTFSGYCQAALNRSWVLGEPVFISLLPGTVLLRLGGS